MQGEDRTRILHMIEAASRISPEMQAEVPDVPWRAIVGMRNRLVHGYFDIDPTLVWNTATTEIPVLLPQLRKLVGLAS